MQRAGSAIQEHAPVPAVLGLNVTESIGDTVLPQSDSQLVVVIDERFAQTVDADTVCAEAHDGIVTL